MEAAGEAADGPQGPSRALPCSAFGAGGTEDMLLKEVALGCSLSDSSASRTLGVNSRPESLKNSSRRRRVSGSADEESSARIYTGQDHHHESSIGQG